jgi:AraC-like DNA-binding protein
MVFVSYNGAQYESVIEVFARALKLNYEHNYIAIPHAHKPGFIELIKLPFGIEIILADFAIDDDYFILRKKAKELYYNLRIEFLDAEPDLKIMINDNNVHQPVKDCSFYLSSSMFDLSYYGKKGFKAKSINIKLTPGELEKILNVPDAAAIFENYLLNNLNGAKGMGIDAWLINLTNEMHTADRDDPLRSFYLFTKVVCILERFVKEARQIDEKAEAEKKSIDKEDVEKMMMIEKYITADLSVLPPTQDELAEKFFIGITKLKYTFKSVFKYNIYEYYQKVRMEKALELLKTGKTVTEAAEELGFKSLYNFSSNFKKQFNVLPGNLKQGSY